MTGPAITALDPEPTEASADLTPIVGANLRRLRVKRGLSLERMAKASGVSRAMLGQIELGHSTPTINVVWKIARALDVSFSTLITESSAPRTSLVPRSRARLLTSQDGSFTSRALFPYDQPRNVEFYELSLAGAHCDAFLVQGRPHILGANAVQDERQHAGLVRRGADHRQPGIWHRPSVA